MSDGVVITPGLPPERFVLSMGTRIVHRPKCRFVTEPGSFRFPYADAEAVDKLPACRVCIPSAKKRRPTRSPRHQHTWGPWRRVAADGGSPASRRDEDFVGHRRSCDCGAFQHHHKENEPVACPCCGETGYARAEDCPFCEDQGHDHHG